MEAVYIRHGKHLTRGVASDSGFSTLSSTHYQFIYPINPFLARLLADIPFLKANRFHQSFILEGLLRQMFASICLVHAAADKSLSSLAQTGVTRFLFPT